MSRKFPAIPQPVRDNDDSIYEALLAMKEAIELMTRQRAKNLGTLAMPTWQELVDLGVITQDQVPRE